MKTTTSFLFGFGLTLLTFICGCTKPESAAPASPSTTPQPVMSKAAANQAEAVPNAEANNERGVMDSVTGLFGDAADAGMNAASDSADYVGDLFHSLKDKGLTTADDTKQWVQEDFQAMGAWEYKVVVLSGSAETVEQKLNELGKDRWDCFEANDETFFLKRPRKSYLRNIPMKDLIKLVPMMQSEN